MSLLHFYDKETELVQNATFEELISKLLSQVSLHGIKEISVQEYEATCKKILQFQFAKASVQEALIPAQLRGCLCGCLGYVPEVREFHAAVPAGTGLEADGHSPFQGNTGQLDHSLYDYFHQELPKRQFPIVNETRVQVLKELERKVETDFYVTLPQRGTSCP